MKKILLILFITGVSLACSDEKFEEMNKPNKAAVNVPAETLFANGVKEMYYLMVNSNVNTNVFRLYGQYWAQTTYPDESQYNMVGRRIPDNFWRKGYRDALKDLDESQKITAETWESLGLTAAERDNRLAIVDICKVYIYATLVDAFGAIPYTEALDPDILSPKYDDGAAVYNSLITSLNSAIASMDGTAAGYTPSQDAVFEGDAAGWKRFGNSLKLKLAIMISDVDATKAGTMVSEAIASGLMTSNAHNASITYLDAFPNTNPVWEDLVQSGRADYVVANTIVDKLKALADPRIAVFAEKTPGGIYDGGVYGDNNTYAAKSHIGDLFHEPTLEGLLVDYSEVEFMLAEAKERGFTVTGTAEEHYNAAITASMKYWGIVDADIATYLANPDVAYATAAGATYKDKIGTQEWIALFNRGFEAWSLWRRLDFPGFNVPPLLTANDMPNRLIFPIEEATLNPTNLTSAIGMIGGADNVQTKVFWDKF